MSASDYALRRATLADVAALDVLIDHSVRGLGPGYYTPSEIEAGLRHVFGVDTQLVSDGTYYLIEHDGVPLACGGWSGRRTLFGGDQHKSGVDDRLDPALDPARIRAFFVHPGMPAVASAAGCTRSVPPPRVRPASTRWNSWRRCRACRSTGARLRVARTRRGAHAVGATAVHQDDSIDRRRVSNARSDVRPAKTYGGRRANAVENHDAKTSSSLGTDRPAPPSLTNVPDGARARRPGMEDTCHSIARIFRNSVTSCS